MYLLNEQAQSQLSSLQELYTKTTLGALTSMTSTLNKNRINFVALMNNIYKELCLYKFFGKSEPIVVTDEQYFKNIAAILESTDPKTIANYFGWIVVSQYSTYTTDRFREIQYEFTQSLSSFPLKRPDLETICSQLLQTTIPWTLSRKYVDNYFDKSDKIKVTSCL